MDAGITKLLDRIRTVHADGNLQSVQEAYEFARSAHAGQRRKSGELYIVHPLAIAQIVADLKLDLATVTAALLHDVPEDTEKTLNDIRDKFGEEVSELVSGVTKLGKIRYHGRDNTDLTTDTEGAQEIENLRRMFFAMAQDVRVILIKLADRLHNMRTIQWLPPQKQRRIARETMEIYAPIANRLGIGEIKGELEDLAFPIVFPKEYKRLVQLLGARLEDRQRELDDFSQQLQKLLSAQHIAIRDIHGRTKHLYSLFQKIERPEYNWDLEKMTDLVAVRVIVPDVQSCYAALGTIHAKYKPVPGKIKDYISQPKPNGYRSIHTTVFGTRGQMIEIQIKTHDMHNEAEHGIAAHWAYAEAGKPKTGVRELPASFDWVQQLARWQREMGRSLTDEEYLQNLKIDFFKSRIFVLTPKGEVKELPEGATAVDFAYAVHTEIGERAMGAKVNGKLTPLSASLANGDIVEILTSKHAKGPSRDWIEFVRTTSARDAIKRYHRQREKPLGAAKTRTMHHKQMILNVADRVGLLQDISTTISALGVNIRSIKTRKPQGGRSGRITLIVEHRNPDALRELSAYIARIRGVTKIAPQREAREKQK